MIAVKDVFDKTVGNTQREKFRVSRFNADGLTSIETKEPRIWWRM